MTTKATDNILKCQLLKNPRITTVKPKTKDVNLLEVVSIRTIQHRL